MNYDYEITSTPIVGAVSLFSGGFEPRGWVECNGKMISRSEFSVLYNLIGNKFGGTGDSFCVPNIPPAAPGVAFYICANGNFPSRA